MSTHVWIALLAAAISVALGAQSWRRRDRRGGLALLALTATICVWSGGYALELLLPGLPWKIFASKIQYLGIPTTPVAWLVVALAYTHSLAGLSRRALAALLALPVITIVLAFTNELHGLIWAQTGLYDDGTVSVAVFSYGPWFAVNVVYSYAVMFLASALFLRTLLMLPVYDRQSLGLVLSALLPWIANLSHITALSPTYPVDLTPLGFALGGVGMALSLRRFRFLDLAPVARTAIVDRLRDAIIVVDTDGRVIDLNPAAHLVLGVQDAGVIGVPIRELLAEAPALIEAAHSNAETTGEVLIGKGDEERRYAMYVAPVREQDGIVCGRLIDLHDITDLRDAEAQVQYLAHRDPLTGLPNRTLFRDRFEQALAVARRADTHVACLFLDLDDFKKVNDHYGHSVGDELLREASTRIRKALRDVDTISRVDGAAPLDNSDRRPTLARFGGDEFVVLLQGLERPQDAAGAAARVVEALREPFQLGQSMISVRTSIGLSVSPQDGETAEVLLRNADAAMYAAKNRGGDSVRFFTPAINEQARARVEMESGLHRALQAGELSLEYQPMFDVSSGNIVALEALIRWNHPSRGRIPSWEFLPVLGESGLAADLSAWAMRKAAGDWRTVRQHLHEGRLALDLSARQLGQPDCLGGLIEILAAEDVPGDQIELSMSEATLMTDPDRSRDVLARLSDAGMRLAIDDFGTGLSSLSQLRSLALDMVRIDASFTAEMSDPTYAALIRAIIALAHELGLETTAKGVESRTQLEFLRQERCDRVQGRLLGRARPLDAAIEGIRGHRGWPNEVRATA